MRDDVATQRYLQRHIEPDLPGPATQDRLKRWDQVLVIPVYRESTELLQQLRNLNAGNSNTIVIIVINRPDTDLDVEANAVFRAATQALEESRDTPGSAFALGNGVDLFVYDLEAIQGPTKASEGVGFARKIGCDIAFKWIHEGAVEQPWIYCTDADATLPPDYFSRTEALPAKTVAALAPFTHGNSRSECESINFATVLYELRLHHYVLGLQYAGSPYAFHTLGSCLQIRASAYAHCRGFPKRSGGEDFYLLNKLRKLGEVTQLGGACIKLAPRGSTRVPFGTGPAVSSIALAEHPLDARLFYHPSTFLALRTFLSNFHPLYEESSLEAWFAKGDMDKDLLDASVKALVSLGLPKAAENFRNQSKNPEQFSNHLHRWFDGFRTLKFLHSLRDEGWPLLSLAQTFDTQPGLWPANVGHPEDIHSLRDKVYDHLGWNPQGPEPV